MDLLFKYLKLILFLTQIDCDQSKRTACLKEHSIRQQKVKETSYTVSQQKKLSLPWGKLLKSTSKSSKNNYNLRNLSALTLLTLIGSLLFPASVKAATTTLNFNNAPTLVSGTALSQGAVYRFANVATGVDALVQITTINNAQLKVLDDNATFVNRFQPTIAPSSSSLTNSQSYVRFDFKLTPSSTPAGTTFAAAPTATATNVYFSAQDVDGNGGTNTIREFVETIGALTSYIANPTLLQSMTSLPVAGGVGYEQTNSSNVQAGIGTDDLYEFYSFLGTSVNTFTIIGGNITGSAGCTLNNTGCDRQNSWTFDVADVQKLDFGDAPVGYGNAYHPVPPAPTVYLGTSVDGDDGPNYTSNADGDDTTGTDDENGVASFPALSTASTSYSLSVACAGGGTVAGWIDFNRNGVFDASEKASGTCSGTSVTLNWTGLSGLSVGTTYARFRTASIASEVANPTGQASNGEVEDYQLSIIPIVSISGKVWDDADNSANNTFTNINTGTEAGTNAGGLNAILVNASGNVIATTPVATDGTYTFNNVTGNQSNVTIRLSTTAGTVGSAAPAASIPANWTNTSPLTTATFNIGTSNITGQNFGIEQLPNTNDVTATSQTNPGGTTTVQVSALSGTDPEDGTLGTGKTFKIVTLPTNGTLYYNGTAVTAGQNITNYDPTKLTIDPNDGTLTISFTYAAVDTGGKQDPSPATVTIPFTVPTYNISGTVFEDVNYGGGAGRPLSTAGTSPRSNATVELYKSDGTFVNTTTTGTDGKYTFTVTSGDYIVRVVNSTVTSSRTGYVAGLLPVQTFRTDASTGTVTDVSDRVGGEIPNEEDAPARSTGQTLTNLNALASKEVQSIAPVKVGVNAITSVDFGFNFDTIVNTNDTGQGSLRQFITNSNALSNTGLTQAGQTAGSEVSIFMISDGAAHPGLRTGLTKLTDANGVAVITPTTALPAISNADTSIDGTTQTTNIGNTNTGVLGSGGNVGTGADGRVGTGDEPTLSQVNRPEVQIVDNNGLAIGLDAQANNTTIRGISIYGFGNATNSDANANIRIGNNYTGTLIEQNIIGATATSFTDPGATARSGGDNIRSVGGDTGKVLNNLIGFSAGKGLGIENTSTGWLVENNEVRGNAIGQPTLDGIDLENSSSSNTVQKNLFVGNQGVGVDGYSSGGSNTIKNNTITGNGRGSTTGVDETPGVRIYGNNSTIINNLIYDNYGAGVMVENNTSGNKISQNSIYNNGNVTSNAGGAVSGQIGIDLLNSTDSAAAGTSPYVTLNDLNDVDAGGNGLLNFPILENATILGGNLILNGFARPGSVIELFIADPDSSGFGEGKTYLVTLTEGSTADTDGTIGTYVGVINSFNQGTDATNRFSFSIPLSQLPGVSANIKLTATATLSNSTSEFSGVATVTTANANVLLVKRITAINGDRTKNPNDNTPLNLFVDDTTSTRKDDDNNLKWKSGYLLGAINAGKVKPGDEIEYTVYFLNAGNANANNVRVCDRITANQDFKVSGYGTSKDLQLQLGTSTVLDLTSVNDSSDRAQFIGAGGTVPSNCYLKATNNNGTLVIDVTGNTGTGVPNLTTMPGSTAQGTPNDSYGFFRFITKVKP